MQIKHFVPMYLIFYIVQFLYKLTTAKNTSARHIELGHKRNINSVEELLADLGKLNFS